MKPKHWQIKSLEEVASFQNGKAHEKIIDEDGKFIVVNSKFVSTKGEVKKFSRSQLLPLKSCDIAMVMSDVPNGRALASCFYIRENGKFTLNQRICCLRAKNNIDSLYLYHYLYRNKYFLSFDSGVGQTNLKKDDVLQCPVLLPPIAEQKRIAEILEVWDEAIAIVEKLITAKQILKRQLGKKLFNIKYLFSGKEPCIKRLEHLSNSFSGGTPSRSNSEYFGGDIPWIKSGEINQEFIFNTEEFMTKSGLENSSARIVGSGSILVAMYGATAGKIAINHIDSAINQAVLAIIPNPELDRTFLY